MDKRLVIFGTGNMGEVAHFYYTHDSPYRVAAFTVHAEFLSEKEHFGVPVIAFEEIERQFPPGCADMFVAVGYRETNHVRAGIYEAARCKGYALATYVSSKATTWPGLEIGDNCFVLEDNTVQPFVSIGNDNIIWSGNHIGHHSSIGNHCFITSHVVISGNVTICDYSFLGVNATIRNGIEIAESNVIGAGALIMKSTKPMEVYPGTKTEPGLITSDQVRL